ncbi:hypothetical protein Tco_1326912 [Tanacetum coccineum]
MTSNGLVIHMLVENRYPLTKEVLSQLLELKLETEEESAMALELIKFVKQQLEELRDSDDDDSAKSDHEREERLYGLQLTKFYVQRVDMVLNPPWKLPFLGAKGLTSPEQTATVEVFQLTRNTLLVAKGTDYLEIMGLTGKETSNPFKIFNDSPLTGVNTPGSDENRLKLYDLMYKNVKVADTMVKD